jgi:pseudaminic acid biosynthesis-associated methylase
MNDFHTEQEKFWAGAFGDEYTTRNQGKTIIASNIALFAKILTRTQSIKSVIEFGANSGLNIQALHQLLPQARFSALEINQSAVDTLHQVPGLAVYHQSITDFIVDYKRDLVLIKGVLIHINPTLLPQVYDVLYNASARYICIAEYYNPTPLAISYRGHADKLFKRDFAGEILDRFSDLKLVDYGFAYRRDNLFAQDDITWFLLEKSV